MPPLTSRTAAARPASDRKLAAVDERENPAMTAGEREIARVMQICNACRYCEGFCAVFPAMTRRLEFAKADTHYLANLCHSCGACLHACQYAPPHEFAVNVPQSLAKVRAQTYQDYAWPSALGRLYRLAGLTVALALAAGLALFLLLAVAVGGHSAHESPRANFYVIFPHSLLVCVFGVAFAFALLALGLGARRFWREISPSKDVDLSGGPKIAKICAPAFAEAASDAASLKYLGGGHGEGCNEEDDRFALARRYFHHLTLYGFLLCFASTSVATLYHYLLGAEAPYAWTSLPVILGALGGVGLLVGASGLLWLNFRRDPQHGDPAQHAMDRGFMALLLLVSATGFALLDLRDTHAMALWLAIHLGAAMALFLTLPYGKFAHGVFRSAALLKYAIEKRLPNRLNLGGD